MSVNSKMTAIADEIRELSSTTGKMGLDAMATHTGNAIVEVDTQSALISQIIEALNFRMFNSGEEISIKTATVTPSSRVRNISFSGLEEEPKMFSLVPLSNTTLNSNYRYVLNVSYNGSVTVGIHSNTTTATYTADGFTFSYANGTLTINTTSTSNGGYFASGVQYQLTYVTGESASSGGQVGGSSVQSTTGTFTTNSSGVATVNCGFKPDIITIVKDDQSATANFNSINSDYSWLCIPNAVDFIVYSIEATRNNTGCSLEVSTLSFDYAITAKPNTSFTYYAIKYT